MYKNKEKLFNNPFKTDNRGILIINDSKIRDFQSKILPISYINLTKSNVTNSTYQKLKTCIKFLLKIGINGSI